MTSEYETAIDSLLSRLIEIIETASQKSEDELDVELKQAFDATSRILDAQKEWKYCKYAMVCWVDSEIIAHYPTWKDNPLEAHYFGKAIAFTEFFKQAQRCYERHFFNAYEVFFICFMFGFRGVYQPNYKTEIPSSLPTSDAEWQEQTSRRLAKINRGSDSNWATTKIVDNSDLPLEGFGSFVNNLIIFVCVLVAAIVFYIALGTN